MWDSPRLLNAAADTLFVAAVLIALWFAAQAALRSPWLPVRSLAIAGDVGRLDAASVGARFESPIAGNFFGIDLAEVRRRLEGVPWVRHAAVRREWPDRLVAEVEAHRALARWSDQRLVNTRGELFAAETDATLPTLAGPPGTEGELARRYLVFRELVAPLATEPVQVLLSARGAWQVKLANGVVLELGRDDGRGVLEARLARFVAAYPRAAAQLNRRLDHADLRYPNGFAIRIPELPAAGDANAARKRTLMTRTP